MWQQALFFFFLVELWSLCVNGPLEEAMLAPKQVILKAYHYKLLATFTL